MSSNNQNHDEMLFEMLRECKTLPTFLDHIFGFLQRRTDFYHISKEPNAVVGLPDGLAEKLLQHKFSKWKPISSNIVYRSNQIPLCTQETVVEKFDNTAEVTSTTSDETKDFTFSKSEYYNGGLFDNYCWSQTISEVDVIVKVPENVTTKNLEIKILSNSISIELENGECLLKGNLCEKCKANDAVWSLDGKKLLIHLDKCQEKWWNCLTTKEPLIDISKIDCSRPYEDLPEEAQAKIEELQWNQERKRLGLPTSEELQMHETLKKAWNAEGSPFSGPFDPSVVKFN